MKPAMRHGAQRQKVLVVGLARTGIECARFLLNQGAKVSVSDLRSETDLKQEINALKGLPIDYLLGVKSAAGWTRWIWWCPARVYRRRIRCFTRHAGAALRSSAKSSSPIGFPVPDCRHYGHQWQEYDDDFGRPYA